MLIITISLLIINGTKNESVLSHIKASPNLIRRQLVTSFYFYEMNDILETRFKHLIRQLDKISMTRQISSNHCGLMFYIKPSQVLGFKVIKYMNWWVNWTD